MATYEATSKRRCWSYRIAIGWQLISMCIFLYSMMSCRHLISCTVPCDKDVTIVWPLTWPLSRLLSFLVHLKGKIALLYSVDMYVQDFTALMFLQEFYIYLYHAYKVLLLFRLFRNQDLSENSSVYFLMGVDKSGMCFMGLLVIDFFDRYWFLSNQRASSVGREPRRWADCLYYSAMMGDKFYIINRSPFFYTFHINDTG